MAFDTSSYDLLKKSKQEEALNKKNNTIATLQTQQGGVENTYKDLADTLAKRKADLAAKNTMDNQNLDTQLKQGTENYMGQRDQGVIANNNQNKAIMDWYAKNNIANSTASADEMGRQATTLSNTLGGINSNKNQFETTLGNTRNLTNLDYNNGVNDIVNQDSAAQREKAQKLAEILAQITGADNSYNSEVQSINDSVEAQKMKDLNDYNERLRQEQLAREAEERQYQKQLALQQASQRASASKSSAAASEKAQQTAMKNQAWANFQHEFNDGTAGTWLQENTDDLINYLGSDEYNKMLETVRKNADQQLYAKRTSNYRIGNGGRMLAE